MPGGRTDWDTVVRDWASENEMSFRDAMGWLSKRETLEIAVDMLGLSISTGVDEWPETRRVGKQVMLSFASFLDHRGYRVPITNLKLPTEEENTNMKTSLTRELYLDERRAGKNRTAVQRESGLGPSQFYQLLRDWGLKDTTVEDAEMNKVVVAEIEVAATRAVVDEPSPSETTSIQREDAPAKRLERKVGITVTIDELLMRHSLAAVIDDVHQTAVDHGWHDKEVSLPVQIALIHSEVSEALEADRKGHGDDKVAEELADVIIRVMDTAAAHKLQLVEALFAKMERNREREYRHGNLAY